MLKLWNLLRWRLRRKVANPSGLTPTGHAVLLTSFLREQREQTKGMIEIPEMVHRSDMTLEVRARVVDYGSACWQEEFRPRASCGDLVAITKMAGMLMTGLDGKTYRLVNDRDIFCALAKEFQNG